MFWNSISFRVKIHSPIMAVIPRSKRVLFSIINSNPV